MKSLWVGVVVLLGLGWGCSSGREPPAASPGLREPSPPKVRLSQSPPQTPPAGDSQQPSLPNSADSQAPAPGKQRLTKPGDSQPSPENQSEESSQPSLQSSQGSEPQSSQDSDSLAQAESTSSLASKPGRGMPPPPEALRARPVRGSDGVWEITFDTIKFPIEKDQPFRRELLTTQIWDLVGKKVRIRGYMLPTFKQTGLTEFVLVRDNMECCFGPGAALYDCIMVYMVPGKTADFSIRPVTVTGTFSVEEFRDFEDVVRAVFRLDAEEVRQ